MNKLYISILLLVSIIASSGAQDVKVTSTFDSSAIYIGDQIKYRITIDQPSDIKLDLPVFRDTLNKNIAILSGPVIDSGSIKDGRIKIVENYLITSFDSGTYKIPPVFVESKNAGGLKRFYSDYTRLKVMRYPIAPADTTLKIYDIVKPYKAPVTVGEILPLVLLLLLLAFVIWLAIRLIRKFKKSDKETEEEIIPDPAHIIAFRELEKLKEEQLWQKGQIKQFYTRLTEIMRQYLENRYKVYSLELTTSETLENLVKSGFKKDASFNQLKVILTGADLVKFAKYNPEASENESHLQNSWDFVLATKLNDEIPGIVTEKDKNREGTL
jgi:hypothetical protein